jgi:ABC-type branched-subunit amino acid transport system permease subunit
VFFGIADPLLQLIVSVLCVALVGLVSGLLLMRSSGLTLIILTLGSGG